jgi:Kdo2-lipid IVA lauroyltransferase/acyltransferase
LFAPKGGDGSKALIISMTNGASVALMNDQKFNRGIPTPFFSHTVDTAPGPTRLAMRFSTYLQPMTVIRLHKARFKVIVNAPIQVENSGNKSVDIKITVCKISEFIEDVVRTYPHEWFWVHKRWPKSAYKASDNT